LVLPKKLRDQARISTNSKLFAKVSGEGRIELFDSKVLATRAQEIGKKKLSNFREDHQAAKYLLKYQRQKK
jgi:bifunctional DNA-binding transcriptional regulator/antitoxin component of YhaV-PrlF toxin-antitoxin module